MSVLKGEGKVPILFGSTSIAVGSRTHGGYLARPDLAGEWPTIVVVPSAWGVTSNVKDICRRLARQGFAVVAPDVYARNAPKRSASAEEAWRTAATLSAARVQRNLADIVSFIQNPSGFWSSAEDGFGLLGLGAGGPAAANCAVAEGGDALALVTPPLEGLRAALAGFGDPVLGLLGRNDERGGDVEGLRGLVPQAELVIYSGVGSDFLDDYLEAYDFAVAQDAFERLTEFFEKHLPAPPASG